MENKIFEANEELEKYLLSNGFQDVTAKVFPHKPGKKEFRGKKVKVDFDYINISIIKGNGILYLEPQISKKELDSYLGLGVNNSMYGITKNG